MLKHNRPSSLVGKLSGGSSSFVSPDYPFRYSPACNSVVDKNKLNPYSGTNLLQHNMAAGTAEAYSGLSNGVPASSPSPGPAPSPSPSPSFKEKLSRKDFPKDISDFRLFQKCNKGKSLDVNPSPMYSVSEEAWESEPEDPSHQEEGEKAEEEVVSQEEALEEVKEMERFPQEQTPVVDTCISPLEGALDLTWI